VITPEATVNRLSTRVLIAANILVAILVATQRWGYYSVILIYWIEAMIVGVFGLVRMCVVCWFGEPLGSRIGMKDAVSRLMLSLILGGFFVVKFGGFALGMGLWVALTPGFLAGGGSSVGLDAIGDGLNDVGAGVLIAAASLFVSHGISFVTNFLGRQEYRHSNALVLLFKPYLRMILVLVVLAAGFAAAMAAPALYRATAFALSVVAVKLLADAVSHRLEHRGAEIAVGSTPANAVQLGATTPPA
jgi:hypothetical protein